jgi:hypothetical protein
MGLDQGDEMMRSRLILKIRSILFNRIVKETPDEDELRKWFELNRAKYDVPPRYTFEQFPLVNIQDESEAKRLAEELTDKPAPELFVSNLRNYQRRPVKTSRRCLVKPAVTPWWLHLSDVGSRFTLSRAGILPGSPSNTHRSPLSSIPSKPGLAKNSRKSQRICSL